MTAPKHTPEPSSFLLVEVVRGPAGCCLSIGDKNGGRRVAGPKPWGGGTTIHSFKVSASDLRKAADEYAPNSLLAVAPELLDALSNVLAIARLKWGNLDPDANTLMERAEAAIAKATGEQA